MTMKRKRETSRTPEAATYTSDVSPRESKLEPDVFFPANPKHSRIISAVIMIAIHDMVHVLNS